MLPVPVIQSFTENTIYIIIPTMEARGGEGIII